MEEEIKEEGMQSETVENPYGPGFAPRTPYNSDNTPEKKSKKGFVIGIVAAVLIVALTIGLVWSGLFSRLFAFDGKEKTSKTVFYQSKDEIHMIQDVTAKSDKIKDVEFAECADDENCLIGVDKSQKYFYYYSEYDYDDFAGTACVIPVNKISDKKDKNEKFTTEIADDVSSFRIVDGGKAVYIVDEDELYYFDGKESYEIDDDVDWMTVYDDIVVYEKYDDDDYVYDLFYAKLTSKPKAEEIDDEIDYVSSYDPNFLIYSKDEDEGLYDLYIGTAEKGCKRFAEEAILYDYDSEKKTIWYGEDNDTEITLDDFFENDLTGPEDMKLSDCLVEVDVNDVLGDYEFSNEEIAEVLDMLTDYSYADERLLEETGKKFYEVDSGYDENDEYVYYYYSPDDKKWFKVKSDDYYRVENAKETYEDFMDEWEDEKDEPLSSNFYTLKYYKNGKAVDIAENVSYASVQNDVCYYAHISDDDFEKISLKKAYESYMKGDYYALSDVSAYMDFYGISYSISGNEGQTLNEDVDMEKFASIYITKDQSKAYVAINEDDDAGGYHIMEFTNKSGTYTMSEKKVAENGIYMGEKDGKVYFLEDYDNEDYVGDLYVRSDGKNKLVSKKVSSECSLYVYGDEAYGFSNYDDYEEADFYRFKDGDKKKVESDVAAYGVYALGEKMFVFFKDDDIYYTDGTKKPVKLAKKVDYLETVSEASSLEIW